MTSFPHQNETWVALAIGNSRLHWAIVQNNQIIGQWDVPHSGEHIYADVPMNWQDWLSLSPAFDFFQPHHQPFPPLWLVSVVPALTQFWQTYSPCHNIRLEDIPLGSIYPTLGVDRALAVWAAGTLYHWPVLVIDCGTALTITGADRAGRLVGGAIMPGVGLQLRSLTQATAALPSIDLAQDLPQRWATATPAAIQSGIIHTLVSGLHDFIKTWQQQYPDSAITFTGGDHQLLVTGLAHHLQSQSEPPPPLQLHQDPHLLLQGIIQLRIALLQANRVS